MEYVKDEFAEAKKKLDLELLITNEDLAQLEARVMKGIRIKKQPIRWIATAVVTLVILGVGIPLAGLAIGKSATHSGSELGQYQQPTQKVLQKQKQSTEPGPGDTMVINGVIQKYGPYIIHNNCYYSATGQEITPDQMGDYIGPVIRMGDWAIKREGDSNIFAPQSTIMYTIKGVDSNKQIVVKIKRNSIGEKMPNNAYKYEVFKNAAPVGKLDTTNIFNATSDTEEVGYALQNIARVDPHLYELKSMGSRAVPFSASLTNSVNYPAGFVANSTSSKQLSGLVIGLKYLVKEANTHVFQDGTGDGMFIVAEYGGNIKEQLQGSCFIYQHTLSSVQKEFDVNGLHWKKYDERMYLGQNGNQYYEIYIQGKISFDKMMEFLQHFQPSK